MKRGKRLLAAPVLAVMFILVSMFICQPAFGLKAEVKPYKGSPMIHVNGKPVSPLMFFGWESGFVAPTDVLLSTEWREFSITVTAPEDTEGATGIHFRMGGEGPGTVWVDNIRVYPGEKMAQPAENWARGGDFEGSRDDVERDWRLFKTLEAEASWTLDTATKASGNQSLRTDITSAGTDHMHVHWYQTGYSVKAGQKYTYSVWMKADKPRTVDLMMVHIGAPWTIYPTESASSTAYVQQVRLARDAGVHIYSFGMPMPWPRAGTEPDFSEVDRTIETTLREDPQALLLPRFDMIPPGWWLDEHPGDRMLFDDGATVSVSVASEAWRAEMQTHLRALVRHCEAKYGDHILGYHPCGQHTGEWFYERSWEPRLSDFSPAMNTGFRNWVQAKYGTVDALRAAWNRPDITFDSVQVPTAERQLHTTLGLFRDPASERDVIDYFYYKQIAMEEPLELMARAIKEETRGNKLTCFFYGYLFDMHGIPMGPQHSGHLAMARMLQCPDVDILCSPISYLDRELGGAGMFMSAVDSVRAHGKLWLNEDDTRTYLTPPASGFGRVDTPQGTMWVHQRNFAQIWPRRLATWYMDLGGNGWLNGKDLWDNIERLQQFYREYLAEPARWTPDVALIVDEDSPKYAASTIQLGCPLVYEMRSQYFRMGAPFGIYLLSDLVAGNVPPSKVYFFANCYRLDARQRKAVLRATRGKTAVWFYGGGFLSDTANDSNMIQMIGLHLRRGAPEVGAGVNRVVPPAPGVGGVSAPALAAGLSEPFRNVTMLDPLWIVDDPGADIIARYPSGGAAVASKQTDDGLRVYVGALHCPAKLLRNILAASGVHVYSDSDDVLLTNGRFISITATSAGMKHLTFPQPCTLTDALDNQKVLRDIKELDLDLALGETRMFLCSD
ncbi:MAG: beta-galactosidase [Candidatus Hydrogenedentes bacterium]|nr:beta-galactosidase [Candidatus Hydrogenedentota bacterium]